MSIFSAIVKSKAFQNYTQREQRKPPALNLKTGSYLVDGFDFSCSFFYRFSKHENTSLLSSRVMLCPTLEVCFIAQGHSLLGFIQSSLALSGCAGLLRNTETGAGIACNGGCQIGPACDLYGEYQQQSGARGNRNIQPVDDTAADIAYRD